MSALKSESLIELADQAWKLSALIDALHIVVEQPDIDGNAGPISGLTDEISVQASSLVELLQAKAREERGI